MEGFDFNIQNYEDFFSNQVLSNVKSSLPQKSLDDDKIHLKTTYNLENDDIVLIYHRECADYFKRVMESGNFSTKLVISDSVPFIVI